MGKICLIFLPFLPIAGYCSDAQIALKKRFHAVQLKLLKKNADPNRIADARAPRFIELSHWEKVKKQHHYSPWNVYTVSDNPGIPTYRTWQSWETAAQWVHQQALANLKKSEPFKIDLAWIQKVHRLSMQGLMKKPGVFRDTANIADAIDRAHALTQEQVSGLRALPYSLLWHATPCLYELSEKDKKLLVQTERSFDSSQFPSIASDVFFKDSNGVLKQCGYYDYPDAAKIRPQLDAWLKFVNSDHSKDDLVFVAAKAQQWFVAIHPFSQGNGRVSRLILDFILENQALPPPVLEDMDSDLYLSPNDWAKQVEQGILRTLNILERCATQPLQEGCSVVATKP